MLSDEKKRRLYDQFGEDGLKEEGFSTGSFKNFKDFFKDFNFDGFGRGNENRHGGNGFKFSFGGGFDEFFKMDDDDSYFIEEDSVFGGSFSDGFGDFGDGFGDFGDSFFGHHRNNHGESIHSRQMYRESSSM